MWVVLFEDDDCTLRKMFSCLLDGEEVVLLHLVGQVLYRLVVVAPELVRHEAQHVLQPRVLHRRHVLRVDPVVDVVVVTLQCSSHHMY